MVSLWYQETLHSAAVAVAVTAVVGAAAVGAGGAGGSVAALASFRFALPLVRDGIPAASILRAGVREVCAIHEMCKTGARLRAEIAL